LFSGVSFVDKLLFTKHLAIMVRSGIAVPEAISSLCGETKSTGFKNILVDVGRGINNGQSLTKTLGQHKNVFDQFYLSLIEVGEESGTLEESLDYLAKQLGKDYALRKKIQGAMMYPSIVFFATFGMGGFISLFILPKLVDFFSSFDMKLPLPTRILLFFANLMKDHGILIFASATAFFVGVWLLIKIPPIKLLWHKAVLKVPVFGNLIVYSQLVRFCRNFGILIKSGVPVAKGLETSSKTMSNLKFKNDLLELAKQLSKGKNIGDILKQKQFSNFPRVVSKMVAVGEKTGKLDETLIYLGDFYEEEIDDIAANLTTILEPIMLIVIGTAVAFIALAIIGPIYELTGSMGGGGQQ
jgi:type IV pilus assembly protein PilC